MPWCTNSQCSQCCYTTTAPTHLLGLGVHHLQFKELWRAGESRRCRLLLNITVGNGTMDGPTFQGPGQRRRRRRRRNFNLLNLKSATSGTYLVTCHLALPVQLELNGYYVVRRLLVLLVVQ